MSKIMLMQTEENEMIGFILFSTDVSVFTSSPWNGNCIFSGVPKNSEVFNNDLCDYLQTNKHIEFQAKVEPIDSGFSIDIKSLLTASLNNTLMGTWSPIKSKTTGKCLVPSTTS